ncbi:MAG: hypothetical protein MO852_09790 [Candidatus Devosia euplotis]|nr:hypothetical protein [Candidatus Devosia euplotis]
MQTTSIAPLNEVALGIALGAPIAAEQASGAWNDLSMKLEPLLFGPSPLLANEDHSTNKRIVLGLITELSEITALCTRLERISISCLPMPFTGTPLSY